MTLHKSGRRHCSSRVRRFSSFTAAINIRDLSVLIRPWKQEYVPRGTWWVRASIDRAVPSPVSQRRVAQVVNECVQARLAARSGRRLAWKGWGVAWWGYAKQLQLSRPVTYKLKDPQVEAIWDWLLPKLAGGRPAGTPCLTEVFGAISASLAVVKAGEEAVGTGG